MAAKYYKIREFAQRAGVTVRTLHHYDRLGLLKPSAVSESGYRLYGTRDFARLQQIVTLKFLGFSLQQIGELLGGCVYDLPAMLRMQRKIMEERREQLEKAIRAIVTAESIVAAGGEPDWETFTYIIEVVTMENNKEWMSQYYSDEQLAKLAERREELTPEGMRKANQDWADLIKEVEGSLDEDPAGEKGQELAARWSALVESFTMGDPGITESLKKLYADQANWPATFKKPYGEDVEAFINKAMAIRRGK
ncbi:MAG: transcriptional regulator, MerR family [Chlorobi bacterium]|nr:transcriptional regulator, MerR family [Chlorobiota bacterium]